MKTNCILLCLFALCWQSQAQYSFDGRGNVYVNDLKKSPNEVRQMLVRDTLALETYNGARAQKTWGNILLTTGIIGTAVVTALKLHYGSPTTTEYQGRSTTIGNEISSAWYALTLGLVAVAIPIKIGFLNKTKEAINTFEANQKTACCKSENYQIAFVGNTQGVGLQIHF
ncbi:MAG: hypothetical protein CFE24_02430 [Flavobacterium sp. BFFFF2]|nr:MAG: hypothetical protein CFE24_02430 [Flavobacterium sp. BFFFF2]